jgi:dihydroneopterin aldolase
MALTTRRRDMTKPDMTEKRVGRIASSSETGEILDRVFVRDYVLDVEIGVYTHEKGVTQRVRFSVDVDVLPSNDALQDDIGRAFDYDIIIDGIKSIIARGHINLVETLAEEVALHCLAHPRAARVMVSIEKLDKDPGAVGVEIVRRKARGARHA